MKSTAVNLLGGMQNLLANYGRYTDPAAVELAKTGLADTLLKCFPRETCKGACLRAREQLPPPMWRFSPMQHSKN